MDNGDAFNESGLDYQNVAGSWSIADTLVTGSAADNLSVVNGNPAPYAFSLDVTGSTFTSNSTTTGGVGTNLSFGDGGSVDVNITGSTFTANRRGAIWVQGTAATINARLLSNTVTGGNAGSPGNSETGIFVFAPPAGQTRVEIDNNAISGTKGYAIWVYSPSGATAAQQLDATITDNTIGNGTALSGSSLLHAVLAQADGGHARYAIRNNMIRNYALQGLQLFASGSATADYAVTQNTISDPSGASFLGLGVASGNAAADPTITCADMGGGGVLGNTLGVAGSGSEPDVNLARKASAALTLPGFTTGGNVQAYIASRNLGSPTVGVSGAPTGQVGGCSLPALPPP